MKTRSKRKNSSSEQDQATEMSQNSSQNGNQKNEKNEWIMFAPKNLIASSDDSKKDQGPYICKVPHPKSGVPALFAFKEEKVYEIVKFSEKYRSWLYNDSVQEDGSLYILTPVDPMFLAIPYLDKVAKKGKYMPLEQILIDKTYQTGLSLLEKCLSASYLKNICDCKGPDDLVAYKLVTEKLLAWLRVKVEKLAEHLKKSKMHVGTGSHAANFVKSSNDNSYSHSEYLQYAFEFVADYIEDETAQKLKENLPIVSSPQTSKSEEKEPPAKRQKMSKENNNNGCVEDYRDKQAKPEKKPVKLTAGQKQLAKIDKTGMKSLNSFFTVTPKKT